MSATTSERDAGGDRAPDRAAQDRAAPDGDALDGAAPGDAPGDAPAGPRAGRRKRSGRWLWLVGVVVVGALVALVVGLLSSAAAANRIDDPRSVQPGGTAALAQLLADEGVRVVPVDTVAEAAERASPTTTLVVANADRLTEDEGRRLLQALPGRVILLRPTTGGLRSFGAAASTVAAEPGVPEPQCGDQAAVRAGAILLDDAQAVYRTSAAPALQCYPVGRGAAYLRTGAATGSVDLVAGGIANEDLDDEGNAAFGMNVFGSLPTVVWLMAERQQTDRTARPTLLPAWWAMAATQLIVALAVIGIWQGRRLGPIMVEPLPVRVRSAETVIGHGRLYQRIGARDRAAEALRTGARERLGRRFGHRHDPDDLVAALAARTGRSAAQVWQLLYGPPPPTDDELAALARALTELEQESLK